MARSASTYASVIDGFKVETNKKYSPVGGTKCNIFAQDVMSAMSAPLPSGLANQMADALLNKKAPGWYSVTFQDAQKEPISGILRSGSKRGWTWSCSRCQTEGFIDYDFERSTGCSGGDQEL